MIRLLVYVLAVFRVTHLLWAERGPFDAADWLRAKAGVYYKESIALGEYERLGASLSYPAASVRYEYGRGAEGFWGELMNCPLCLSGWVAMVAMVGYALKSWVLDVVATWLAVWGVVVLIFKVIGDDE